MMIEVRKDVIAATGGYQVPWENSSLTTQFYFAPASLCRSRPRRSSGSSLRRAAIRVC